MFNSFFSVARSRKAIKIRLASFFIAAKPPKWERIHLPEEYRGEVGHSNSAAELMSEGGSLLFVKK